MITTPSRSPRSCASSASQTFLGIFEATELVPVPIAPILRTEAQPAPLGSARWTIVNAQAGEGVPIT